MLARLEEARERQADEDRTDPVAADAAYSAAFREFGIDPDALPPQQASAALRASAIAVPLAFALDDWARVRRKARAGGTEGGDARLSWLAAQADTDPWRS